MNRQFSYLYILYVLLSVFYVNSKPSPKYPGSQSSVSASIRSLNATNDIELRCFSPALYPERSALNSTDCDLALMKLVLTPRFNVLQKFSKNMRRLDTLKVPRGWGQGKCIIMLSCENDRDTASFKLADVARQVRAIINYCIEGHDTTYGGIVGVSDVPTFYVSIAGPIQGESTTVHDTEPGGSTTFLDTE